MTVISMRKRRIRRPRKRLPSKRRKIRVKSLFPRRTIIIHKGDVTVYKIRGTMPRLFKKFRAPFHIYRNFINFTKEISRISRNWKKPQSKTWKPKSWQRKKTSFPIRWERKKTTWGIQKKWDIYKKPTRKYISPTKFKPHIKKKTEFEPYIQMPRFGKKGFLYSWRGGARDMSGRIYKNYGPYPKELGPDLIFEIIPTSQFKASLWSAEQRGRNMDYFKKQIKEGLDKLRENLIKHAKKTIKTIVPKETGDLQNSMIDSLLESQRIGYRLKMEISAKVDWAGVANKMPTRKVRHSGKSGQIGRRSGQLLYDPDAETDSYKTTILFLKKKAKKLIEKMIEDLTSSLAWRSKTGAWKRPQIETRYKGGEKKIRPMTEEERYEMKEVRMQKLRTRMWKEGETTQVDFPKDLIREWFKIKGLDI